MRVVIDIDENSYKATCSGSMLPPDVKNVVNAIKNGTILPEGHGDLVDRNALEIEIKKQIIYCDDRAIHQSDLAEQLRYMNTSYGLKLSHNIIEVVPTMIDADKENEDDTSSN